MEALKTQCFQGFYMEMRGIEPLSENPSIRTSPITVSLLSFPRCNAD
nr:MAG TPA: Sulfotransferase 4A1 [Caudoviricetes sp.]